MLHYHEILITSFRKMKVLVKSTLYQKMNILSPLDISLHLSKRRTQQFSTYIKKKQEMSKYLIYISFVVLLSCDEKTEPQAIDFSNTEELQNQKTDRIKYSKIRSRDIVRHLYDQAVEKDPKLRLLENEIVNFNDIKQDSLAKIREFIDYNNLYYASANNYAQLIKDSVKRKRILSFLSNSNSEYKNMISQHSEIANLIEILHRELEDQSNIMKIVISEALMDSYQKNTPKVEPLESVLKKLQALISDSEKYTKTNK
jgi:hypothetical protein